MGLQINISLMEITNNSPKDLPQQQQQHLQADQLTLTSPPAQTQKPEHHQEDKPQTSDKQDPNTPTSDSLSVCIWGIQKFFDEKQCLRFYRKHFESEETRFQATSVFKPRNKPFFYLRFNTTHERDLFLSSAKKQRKIRLKEASSIEEPHFVPISELTQPASQKPNNKPRPPTSQQLLEITNTKIEDIVQPFHHLPYEQQVLEKRQMLQKVIQNYNVQFFRDQEVKEHLKIDANRFPLLQLHQFVSCETSRTMYRNKTEFTIGLNANKEISVGFNKGSYQNSTVMIEDPRNVSIVPKRTKMIGAVLQSYIKASEHHLLPYDRVQQKGFWRYLVIRESQRTNEVLILVVVSNVGVEEEKLVTVEKELVQLFRKSIIELKGLCIMYYNGSSDSIPIEKPRILYGEGCYHQTILGHTFRVSSSAFLQTHTPMCEVLYSKIIEVVSECDLVLDLCCGIGTIGICIKKKNPSLKVIGIQLCSEAVEDAKMNDPEYEVQLGRVEDTIKGIVESNKGLRIVAVLDPPRAGMGKDVITALRRCRGLDHVIYVACSPSSVQDNILGLTLPTTTKRKAPHFVVKSLTGFDLFPQTRHYEALFYLVRA